MVCDQSWLRGPGFGAEHDVATKEHLTSSKKKRSSSAALCYNCWTTAGKIKGTSSRSLTLKLQSSSQSLLISAPGDACRSPTAARPVGQPSSPVPKAPLLRLRACRLARLSASSVASWGRSMWDFQQNVSHASRDPNSQPAFQASPSPATTSVEGRRDTALSALRRSRVACATSTPPRGLRSWRQPL